MKKIFILVFFIALSFLSCNVKKEQANTEKENTDSLSRPNQPTFRNLEVDTTELFGVWVQYKNAPHADFWINKKHIFLVHYANPEHIYILDKNEITIFYDDVTSKGTIISTKNDTLKIKWEYSDETTEYIRFEAE